MAKRNSHCSGGTFTRNGRYRRKTKGVLLGFIILILVAGLFSCTGKQEWVTFRGYQGRGGTSNAIYPPLGVKWKLKLQLENNQAPVFNPPVVKGDTIYFGSPDGNFYALDINTGYMRWVFSTDGMINSTPSADSRKVYFGSNDGRVYAVSMDEGKKVWSFETESTVQSNIIRYQDYVIFTSDGGSTYFLSPEGRLRYKIPNPVWHYYTFQVYDNVLYFAPGPMSNPHSLGAYHIEQKSYQWVLNTWALRATWYSFAAIKDGLLFFATCAYRGQHWDLTYYCFDTFTGELIWKYRDTSVWGSYVPEDLYRLFRKNLKLLDYMAPSVWRNLVIYTSGDACVRAFHVKRGSLEWVHTFEYPTSSAPTVAGDRVYLGLRGSTGPGGKPPRLVCLSARNGEKLWQMPLEGAMLNAPVISGEWLVFGTDANMFYVLEELY
ncbi:MAG: PQQ-binding-like beta-propeller repeat protein [Spirochaetota bacterium]